MSLTSLKQPLGLIAYAEDDEATREAVSLYLAYEGYTVIGYEDGKALMLGLSLSPVKPDVILTDLHMPGTCGFGLIESIHSSKEFSSIPVIAFTGSNVVPIDVITVKKPGSGTALVDAIETAIENSKYLTRNKEAA